MAKTKKGTKPTPSDLDDFAREAHEMGDDYAPAFIFENPGDVIVGTVVEIGEAFSKEYGAHPCVTVADEATGEARAIHVFHAALISQMTRQNPQVGERIAVKRLDDRKNAKGQTYQNFRVKVQREDGKRSFADVAPSDDVVNAAKEAAPAPPVTEPDDDLPF